LTVSIRHLVLAAVVGVSSPRRLRPKPLRADLPRGFPPPNIPADNLLTWEKVELGRFLFYDTR
jgi:cytochrome c peroxidase